MNKEMRKFYRKLNKMDNRGVTFKAYDGRIISDFPAEDLNLPEGYSIEDNKIYKGEVEIGKLEVVDTFEETDEIDLEDFDDLDIDFDLEEDEEERKFSLRNGLNAVRYGISNFFGNLGKRKEISIDDENIEKEKNRRFSIRHGLNSVRYGVSNFFENFGKRKQIIIGEDIINEHLEEDDITPVYEFDDKLSEITDLFKKIEKIKDNNSNIEFNEFDPRLELCKKEYNNFIRDKASISDFKINELKNKIILIINGMNNKVNNQMSQSNNVPTSVTQTRTIESEEEFEDLDIDVEEPKRVKIFRKLKGAASLAGAAIRNFFYGVANNTSRFFENFGKKKEIVIDEDIIGDDEEIEEDEDITVEEQGDSDTNELEDKMDELSIKLSDLEESTSQKLESLEDESLKERYANTMTTMYEILFGIPMAKIKELLDSDNDNAIGEFMDSTYTLEEQITKVEAAIKYLEDVNKSLDADIEKSKNTTPTTPTNNTYSFVSDDDVKAKFKEYDNYESVEEKIKYYEDFLKTHDLSHPADQPMKERMEQKLAELKQKYEDRGKNADNDNRSEQMAYYTQVAKDIDRKIDRINKERQLKILQAELEGKTIVNLGLAEERRIDERKLALLRTKRECLVRKAEVNKYYEGIAARMTQALKR